ncbi:MAG TPA: exodeoxyribonuclease VII large subunit [Patescibacteria group bacterium]|jgi:exodeoxyribonuclease VII large subunit|nr:exodeoxyribonuclease VII large subunit [Patescibacteria group bacterium]
MIELELSVSEFVDLFNQTLDFAYPKVTILGELANFRISKDKWIYFDLKDETATIHFFGSVWQLPGPLEDGMMLRVISAPRLHPQYGFTMNIQKILLSGEGTIKKAAKLLEIKLASEGLFDADRKRPIPFPAQRIGLITSKESAAYSDFTKIINERWGGLEIFLCDVQVQGEASADQIIRAVDLINQYNPLVDVIVVTRGGGSQEDLQTFNVEAVVRAIAGSRIPTLVAIGHERDISLAEAAADRRGSTPTNAAELLVPDKQTVLRALKQEAKQLDVSIFQILRLAQEAITASQTTLGNSFNSVISNSNDRLLSNTRLLELLNPNNILARGYALIRKPNGIIIKNIKQLNKNDIVNLNLSDGVAQAEVKHLIIRNNGGNL